MPLPLPTTASSDYIGGDVPCVKCGYNLKGLPRGGKCPECGQPIRARRRDKRFTDNLADAPPSYLRFLARGLGTMAVCSLASAIAFMGVRGGQPVAWSIAVTVTTVAYFVGVLIATHQRPRDEHTLPDSALDSPKLRAVNRLLQAPWMLAAFCYLAAAMVIAVAPSAAPTPGAAAPAPTYFIEPARLYQAAAVLRFIALTGLVPMAIYLASLADWAGDSSAADRLRGSAWAMAFFGLVSLIGAAIGTLGGALPGILLLASYFATALFMVSNVVFLISLFQLAYAAAWAVNNAENALEAQKRSARRVAASEREMAERTARALRAMDAAAPRPASRPRPPR